MWRLSLLLVFFVSCAHLSTNSEGNDVERSLEHQGRTRAYLVHVPKHKPLPEGFPLVLAFHGGSGTAKGFDQITHMNSVADEMGFVVVYPQGIDRQWNDGRPEIHADIDDLGFVDKLIDEVAHEFPVNSYKIFATGMSNGGLFVFRLACDRANHFAALAPVMANMGAIYSKKCSPNDSVPILNVIGDDDPLMPFQGGEVKGPLGFRKRGEVLSSESTVNFWVTKNGCAKTPAVTEFPRPVKLDNTSIMKEVYKGSSPRQVFVRMLVKDGGHTWPGGEQYLAPRFIGKTSKQIDASREILKFFSEF